MCICGECKTSFPTYPALKGHFKTDHRDKFLAICLWLGDESGDETIFDPWWWYEPVVVRQEMTFLAKISTNGGQKDVVNA